MWLHLPLEHRLTAAALLIAPVLAVQVRTRLRHKRTPPRPAGVSTSRMKITDSTGTGP